MTLRKELNVMGWEREKLKRIYSGVYVLVLLISEYWQQNDDKDKFFVQVLADVRKCYWPGG